MEAPDLPAEGDTIEQQIAFADPVQSQQAGEDDQNVDFAAERKERESGWGLEQAYVWGKVMRGRGYPAYFRPFEEVRGIPIRKVVAGGGYHWAALSINGQMYVCGQGEDGQLGLGADIGSCDRPVLLGTLQNKFVTQISVGVAQTAAVTAEGELYLWGTSSFDSQSVPRLVDALKGKRVEQVALGLYHVAALIREADEVSTRVYTWGRGDKGQLGHGTRREYRKPTIIEALKKVNVLHIASGEVHMAVITDKNRLIMWGSIVSPDSDKDLLGVPGSQSCILKPKKIPRLKNVTMAACGARYTVAVTKSGAVFTWGYGNYGCLGHGTRENAVAPLRVHALRREVVKELSAGLYHCLVATEMDGSDE